MSEKEKERGEALTPKEKKRKESDHGQNLYVLFLSKSTPGAKVKAIQGLYINFSNYGKEILVLLCMVMGKMLRVFGSGFSCLTSSS